MPRDLQVLPYGTQELYGDIKPLYGSENVATSFMADGLLPAPGGFDYEPEAGRCSELTKQGFPCRGFAGEDGLCVGHRRKKESE